MSLKSDATNPPGNQAPLVSVELWMPWFIRDHRAVSSTFDHVEHSALTYLKMLMWEGGGSVRDDDKWLAKNLHLSVPKWKAIRSNVLTGCTVADGLITSTEIANEFSKAQANVEQKRRAGMASARARKEATAVERTLNGRTNGSATARQPRAGSGEGNGPYQAVSMGEIVEERPFRVVEGGGK